MDLSQDTRNIRTSSFETILVGNGSVGGLLCCPVGEELRLVLGQVGAVWRVSQRIQGAEADTWGRRQEG